MQMPLGACKGLAARALLLGFAPMQGRVLLVDDNDANREMLAFALRKDGHRVIEASDGICGMTRYTSLKLLGTPPHVVIADVYMPNVSGLAFAQDLRARGARLHMLIITASSTEDVRRQARAMGVDLMTKPLDIDLLRDKVARWVVEAGAGEPPTGTRLRPSLPGRFGVRSGT